MITVKFIRPPVRKYQMENLYEKKFIMVRKKKGGQKSVKKKNDRQPPQRLEEERYANDYWLDEEDGGEDIPDLAVSSRPVSGRLHSEPMVTGYEALERQRGIRRSNRKLTRREKKALKGHRNMKRNFIKSMKKPIRKMRRKKQSLRRKQRNRQCVKQRKVQRRKRAVPLQHRRDSSRKGRRFREEKAEPQKRK